MRGAEVVVVALALAVGAVLGGVSLSRLRSRRGRPEIRLTITRDALPARGGTSGTGGPADLVEDGGRAVHVAEGTDPLLEEILSHPAGDAPASDAPWTRAHEAKAAGVGRPPVAIRTPAFAMVGAGGFGTGGAQLSMNGAEEAHGDGLVRSWDAWEDDAGLPAARPDRPIARTEPAGPPKGAGAGAAGDVGGAPAAAGRAIPAAGHGMPDATATDMQPRVASGVLATPVPAAPSAPGSHAAPDVPAIPAAPEASPLGNVHETHVQPGPDSHSTLGVPVAAAPPHGLDAAATDAATTEGAGHPLDAIPPGGAIQDEAIPAASVPCAEERRLVAERCSVATRAREAHQIAHDTFRATQREYDRTVESVERARKVVDGRMILEEKSEAQRRFRAARLSARTPAEIELAAGTWLNDVNRINAAVRQGNVQLAHGRERTSQLVVELERLSARLDAARIAAATADQDCHAAREALAACEEARSGSASVAALQAQQSHPGVEGTAAEGGAAIVSPERVVPPDSHPAVPPPAEPAAPGSPLPIPPAPVAHPAAAGGPPVAHAQASGAPPNAPPGTTDDAISLGHAPYGATPMILRILRGDRDALDRIVTVLAAGSDDEARRWHLDLGALVDAIVAAAIDAAVLDLPQDHAFWGNFSPGQARQVAGVLGGLGSRYDGRGGFADGRVPSARDLALAVGYTGMDPRRVRHWPNEAQMTELYRGVAVAADAFVAEGAPDLTLGQMVGLLGRHAETLTALWDEWGRVRPLLLAASS
jgi:hypothetical protein